MPQFSRLFAVLVPIVAAILVWRSLDVSARIQLSWPLALHPEGQDDTAQLVMHDSDAPKQAENVHKQEDAAASPESFKRRIVAVGDLHGDLPNAFEVLKMAGVVTEEGHWSGNVDFFVQTGDIIDR